MEHPRVGKWTWIWAKRCFVTGLGAAGGSRGGVGEAAAGSPGRRFLLSVFAKEISNIPSLFATCRPPSQKTVSLSL